MLHGILKICVLRRPVLDDAGTVHHEHARSAPEPSSVNPYLPCGMRRDPNAAGLPFYLSVAAVGLYPGLAHPRGCQKYGPVRFVGLYPTCRRWSRLTLKCFTFQSCHSAEKCDFRQNLRRVAARCTLVQPLEHLNFFKVKML